MSLRGAEGPERGPRGDPGRVGLGAVATRSRGAVPGRQCQGGNARVAMPALLLLAAFQPLEERGRDNKRRGDCKHGPVSMAA